MLLGYPAALERDNPTAQLDAHSFDWLLATGARLTDEDVQVAHFHA